MTEQPTRQRRDRRERRAERTRRSKERQQSIWADRFEAAQTPLEHLGVAVSLLRARLVQHETKAGAAVERAETDEELARAQERLATARAEVAQVCGELAEVLVRAGEHLDTARK